jgi:hypothetical protein
MSHLSISDLLSCHIYSAPAVQYMYVLRPQKCKRNDAEDADPIPTHPTLGQYVFWFSILLLFLPFLPVPLLPFSINFREGNIANSAASQVRPRSGRIEFTPRVADLGRGRGHPSGLLWCFRRVRAGLRRRRHRGDIRRQRHFVFWSDGEDLARLVLILHRLTWRRRGN